MLPDVVVMLPAAVIAPVNVLEAFNSGTLVVSALTVTAPLVPLAVSPVPAINAVTPPPPPPPPAVVYVVPSGKVIPFPVPSTFRPPTISNFATGVSVPIPTFPVLD